MITIKEVADIAGVSPTTVSNVLHGRTRKMSPKTLEAVMNVLHEHKYVANMGGRILGKNGSRIIGVIMTYSRRDELNALQDPFYSEIIGALENEIRSQGYFMMLYTSADVEETLRMAAMWNVEALIVLGCQHGDYIRLKDGTEVPLVFVDTYFYEESADYVNVGLQDKKGAHLMASYLLEQGHRKIAFVSDAEEPVGVDLMRLEGYKQALAEHGLPFRDRDLISLSFQKDARHAFLRNFARSRLRDYTALMFASDFYAVDAMNVFYDEGIRVPRDISITGYDDNIFATSCRPQLTTVRQHVSLKAKYAVSQALRLIRSEPLEQSNIRLPVTLKIRESVAKLG